MSGHTPGPWEVSVRRERAEVLQVDIMRGEERVGAATVRGRPDRSVADGHLMAAAPDLLAALEAIVSGEHTNQSYAAARAAIAKARGAS